MIIAKIQALLGEAAQVLGRSTCVIDLHDHRMRMAQRCASVHKAAIGTNEGAVSAGQSQR